LVHTLQEITFPILMLRNPHPARGRIFPRDHRRFPRCYERVTPETRLFQRENFADGHFFPRRFCAARSIFAWPVSSVRRFSGRTQKIFSVYSVCSVFNPVLVGTLAED